MFEPSDPLLLLSIIISGGRQGAGLSYIIGAGDYINKAIFENYELHGGLCRLTKAGYVREANGKFYPNKRKLRSFYTFYKKTKRINKLLDFLDQLIGAKEYTPGYSKVQAKDKSRYPGLTDKMIAAAVKEYIKRFWETKE